MSIKLEITDVELLSAKTLMAAASFLASLAGNELVTPQTELHVMEVDDLPNPTHKWKDEECPPRMMDRMKAAKPEGDFTTITPDPDFDIFKKKNPHQDFVNQAVAKGKEEALQKQIQPDNSIKPDYLRKVSESVYDPTPIDTAQHMPRATVELDSAGLPWDARIHSRAKTKIANGTWKFARGIATGLIDSVTAELKSVMAIPAPSVPMPPKNVPVPPELDPMIPPSETFQTLIGKITAGMAAKKITQVQVLAVLNAVGIPTMPLIPTRPDLIPSIGAQIDAIIAGA